MRSRRGAHHGPKEVKGYAHAALDAWQGSGTAGPVTST